jgi:hypothetical protein
VKKRIPQMENNLMIRTLGVVSLVIGLIAFAVAGCSGKGATWGSFLGNYGDLKQTPTSDGWYVYFNRDNPVSGYSKFTIAPLIVQFTPERPKPVSMQDVNRVEQAYHAAVTAALTRGGRFQEVNSPGDRTLLLKGAVTDLYQRDPKTATGRATFEMDAVDAVTRKRVFAVIDPALGTRQGAGEFSDPKDVFQKFANELRTQIDQAPTSSK